MKRYCFGSSSRNFPGAIKRNETSEKVVLLLRIAYMFMIKWKFVFHFFKDIMILLQSQAFAAVFRRPVARCRGVGQTDFLSGFFSSKYRTQILFPWLSRHYFFSLNFSLLEYIFLTPSPGYNFLNSPSLSFWWSFFFYLGIIGLTRLTSCPVRFTALAFFSRRTAKIHVLRS